MAANRRILSLIIGLRDEASQKLKKLGQATAVFAAAAAALTLKFAKDSLSAFTVQQDAIQNLEASLLATGKTGAAALKTLTDQASELQKITKLGDEAIIDATASFALLAPALDADELARSQKALIGIADTFLKGDLASAALLVGKSLSGTINALSRYGIEIDTTATQSEKLNQILEQTERFFSVSEAKAKTLSGRLQQMKNAWGDLKEAVGEFIEEKAALTAFLFELTNIIETMILAIETRDFDTVKEVFGTLGRVAGISFASAFFTAIKSLFTGLLDLIPPIVRTALAHVTPIIPLLEQIAGLAGRAAEEGESAADAHFEAFLALKRRLEAEKELRELLAGPTPGPPSEPPPGEGFGPAPQVAGQRGASTVGLQFGAGIFAGEMPGGPGLQGAFGAGVPFTPGPEALSAWEQFRNFVGETGDIIIEMTENQEAMAEVMGGTLLNAIQGFGTAFEAVGAAVIDGSVQIGEAFKGAMLGAIAAVARGLGELYTARAVAALAQGIAGDPRGFAAAGKWTAAAALAFAVAGAASQAAKGGGGGGGGSAGAGGVAAASEGAARGEATIIIQGGLLDMTNPEQADALAEALSNLSGRRVTIIGG